MVFADEAIEVVDLDLPTALDRLRLEHVEEDEAEDQGELQPRAFLGAPPDGVRGGRTVNGKKIKKWARLGH